MPTLKQKSTLQQVPKLRFSGFSGQWQNVRLGDFLVKYHEKATRNKQYPVLTSSQKGIFFQKDYFAGKDVASADTTGYNVVPRGYFTYRHMSDTLIFKFNINKIVDNGIVSTLYPVFTTKGVDDNFLLLKLNEGSEFKKYAILQKQGGSRTYMYYSKLENLYINLPSLPEQSKIASFLESMDKWIENLSVQKEYLESYKAGMMQKIFSQEIRFKGEDGEIFPPWAKVQLQDVLMEHKTRNKSNDFTEVFSVAKGRGVVNQIEHLGRSYSSDDLSNYKVIFPGDVVYTKSPTAGFPFGIIKQNRLDRAGIVSTLYAVFRPVNPSLGFLLHEYFLSSTNTFNYLNPLVRKGAKNTMNISNTDFLDGAKISLPTSEREQRKISELLISLDNSIEAKQQQIAQARQWRVGLLQELFI